MREIPQKYNHHETEQRQREHWERTGVYKAKYTASRESRFVVDTPPPTVSGSLHVGHVFSYTQTDVIVRYQRMLGKEIVYPMGWDDNGLPTERRVQNKFGIRCQPSVPYDPNWKPVEKVEPEKGAGKKVAEKDPVQEVSRQNFIEACSLVTKEDEAAFEDLWRNLGLSVDWSEQYATIDPHCRKVSQISFLDFVEKKLVYSSESPTMWDVDFQTALAQADLEDRQRPGAYHELHFQIESGGEFVISTTRPELLVSCIAVVAHPDDARYTAHFGKNAITPLFGARVPIRASTHADPEKGTGILMVCTFGDIADVDWWKTSGLPLKQSVGRDGRFLDIEFGKGAFQSEKPEIATQVYAELKGKRIEQARRKIVEIAQTEVSGYGRVLVGDPKPVEHAVKFYEKGERPIEFVTTRQWFVRLLDQKDALLGQGAKIHWHPEHMRARYDHWVQGLSHDWCISRQRYFGVPFPVWYPVNENGDANYEAPIFAARDALPVDPLSEPAPGFTETQRGKPNGFVGDPDVMDTWATSSLTPQIVSHWGSKDETRHKKLFPMDLRPQAHEIIRTWAFYTIAKAWLHEREVPWKNIAISGWILDPDRKKMSKSKGNVVTPKHLLEQYSSDGVRYWAARARLGVDTKFDEKIFKNGQKLSTKIFNASRFVLLQIQGFETSSGKVSTSDIREELDLGMVDELRKVINLASAAFEEFDYAGALQSVESSFWFYCDNYLELVKARAYSSTIEAERRSAVATLSWSLKTYLRLFAPFLPFVTEEVWSWSFVEDASQSIHTTQWPSVDEVASVSHAKMPEVLAIAAEILADVHQQKSAAQKGVGWPVSKLDIEVSETKLTGVGEILSDLVRASRAEPSAVQLRAGKPVDGKSCIVQVILGEKAE